MAVIRRADWGAGPHRAGTIPLPVSRLFLHHSVTPFWLAVQAARNLQTIARARGFLDISYSWLTDRQGNEIEGRGWGRSGAHTRGFNTTSHAICGVGNMETNVMPDGMVRGHVRLVRRHRRVGPGRITHVHSDVAATACPGRHSCSRVPAINAAASAPQEDDMPTAEQVADAVWNHVISEKGWFRPARASQVLGDIFVNARRGAKAIDVDKLAERIAVKFVELRPGESIDLATVKAGVKAVLLEGVDDE